MLRPGLAAILLAATAAAVAAPRITGASIALSFASGSAVISLAVAVSSWRRGRGLGSPAVSALAVGWLVLSAASAATLLPLGLRPKLWVVALPALILLALASDALLRLLAAQRNEVEVLRSRLARREGDVRAQADRIRRLDLHDGATRLLNRRGFVRAAEESLRTCADERQSLALLLIDTEGRLDDRDSLQGRALSRRLGRAVGRAVRGSDVAGRWDAGLLALLLPHCEDTRPAIERLRASLSKAGITEGEDFRFAGVSIGPQGPWPDAEGLMAAAQAALGAARSAPKDADVAVWPIDWGLASLNQTHPA